MKNKNQRGRTIKPSISIPLLKKQYVFAENMTKAWDVETRRKRETWETKKKEGTPFLKRSTIPTSRNPKCEDRLWKQAKIGNQNDEGQFK